MEIQQNNSTVFVYRWRPIQEKEAEYLEKNRVKTRLDRASLLGFIAGDGNILVPKSNFHHTVRFFPDCPIMMRRFCESFKRVYNKEPKIKKLKNHFEVSVDSKVVVLDLIKHAKFGQKTWEMPMNILRTGQEKIQWIRSFFDCEAYVNNKVIRVQTINHNGMLQIKSALQNMGIESRLYKYEPKKENWQKVHILVIGKKCMRKKYLDLVGFNHQSKLAKLKKSLDL